MSVGELSASARTNLLRSRVAWAFSLAAVVLLLGTHLWPEETALSGRNFDTDDVTEPNWQSRWKPIDGYVFQVLGLIGFCLHGYSNWKNKPRLGVGIGLISGVAAFMLVLQIYYQAIAPMLLGTIEDITLWAIATADSWMGGDAGVRGIGIIFSAALLVASFAARFATKTIANFIDRRTAEGSRD